MTPESTPASKQWSELRRRCDLGELHSITALLLACSTLNAFEALIPVLHDFAIFTESHDLKGTRDQIRQLSTYGPQFSKEAVTTRCLVLRELALFEFEERKRHQDVLTKAMLAGAPNYTTP
jgi:hypothetical protein